jgi:prevent-host-death family protein
MATTVNIYEAKAKLSKLVDLASQGEDIILACNGKPAPRLTTLEEEKRPILFGALDGKGELRTWWVDSAREKAC